MKEHTMLSKWLCTGALFLGVGAIPSCVSQACGPMGLVPEIVVVESRFCQDVDWSPVREDFSANPLQIQTVRFAGRRIRLLGFGFSEAPKQAGGVVLDEAAIRGVYLPRRSGFLHVVAFRQKGTYLVVGVVPDRWTTRDPSLTDDELWKILPEWMTEVDDDKVYVDPNFYGIARQKGVAFGPMYVPVREVHASGTQPRRLELYERWHGATGRTERLASGEDRRRHAAACSRLR